MDTFIQLEDLLLAPPLAALVSVAMSLGLLGLGYAAAVWLRGRTAVRAIDIAGGVVLATGFVCSVAQWLALAGFASAALLRLGAISLIVFGAWNVRRFLRQYWSSGRLAIARVWRTATLLERWVLVSSAIVISGLALAALGPATEIDSLDYHLGIPLDWLRNGGATERTDWLTSPFIGVGDGINLIGLAAGTDSLGALIQVAGVLIALTALVSCANDDHNRVLLTGVAAGCLAWVTLVPSQKPFVLPASATTVAAVLLARRDPTARSGTWAIVVGCIAFAVGCKFNFLFSGAVLSMVVLLFAWRSGRVLTVALVASAAFFVFALPTYGGNLWLYGDPIWPFLQRFTPDADPVALDFAWYIRNFGSSVRSWRHYISFPLELVVPTNAERFGNALGLGCLTALLGLWNRNANRTLLFVSGAVTMLVLVLGQLTPRFFLEPYLWCGAAVATTSWGRMKRVLLLGLTLQLTVMAIVAIYAAVVLFPGVLGDRWRHNVMDERAPGSEVCRWMDRTLPPDAVIASTIRAHALYPRRFVASDFARFLDRTRLDPAEKRNRLLALFREHGVNVLVVQLPVESGPYATIAADIGPPLGPPVEFREATRNPLGRGAPFRMQAFRIGEIGE